MPLSVFLRLSESLEPVSPRLSFSDRLDTCSFKRRSRCSSSAFNLIRQQLMNPRTQRHGNIDRRLILSMAAMGVAPL